MISVYKFNEPNSTDAKVINGFLDEMKSDQHSLSRKSTREVFFKRYYDSIRRLLASGFSSLIENLSETGDRLRWTIEEEEGGNNSEKLDEKTIATPDELLEYKSITTS